MRAPTNQQLQYAVANPKDHIVKDNRAELRRYCRASLYYFAKNFFGKYGLNERAHLPSCNFAQSIITKPRGYGLLEDPRGTGKSSAITESGVAWCLIQDPKECGAKGWLPLGPQSNIMVVSYKAPFAITFVKNCRDEMEKNPMFNWLFGELVPESTGAKDATWATSYFNVVRESGSGYSVMALGTESGSASKHPIVGFIDDLINEKNYKSRHEVLSQKDWMAHSFNLTDSTDGARLVIENGWTDDDVNSGLKDENKKTPGKISIFSRSIVVCDDCEAGRALDEFGNPVEGHSYRDHTKPERPLLDHKVAPPYAQYTMSDVSDLMKNLPRGIVWPQHFNNPLAREDLAWEEAWLRSYHIARHPDTDVESVVILKPPRTKTSGGIILTKDHERGFVPADETRLHYVPFHDLSAVVAMDPGLKRPGLACVGRSLVPTIGDVAWVLECSTKRLTPKEQFFLLFDWVLRWQAKKFVYESVALQGYIQETVSPMALKYEDERNKELPTWLTKPNWGAKRVFGITRGGREGNKAQRTEDGLGPFAEGRLIAVRPDTVDFVSEYKIFPKGAMDGLEAVLMGIRAGGGKGRVSEEERERIRAQGRVALATYKEGMRGAIGYGQGV